MIEIEKLKKSELIEKYKKLQEEYEELKQQYNDLDECYEEIEIQTWGQVKEEIIANAEEDIMEKFLREFRFSESIGTEFNKVFFEFYKNHFIELMRFYCIDVPDEIYNVKANECKMSNDMAYGLLEKLVDEFESGRDLK